MHAHFLNDPISLYFPRVTKAGRTKVAADSIPKPIFVQALEAFNETLAAYDEKMTFLCVGGGAMMLAYGSRGATHDLDGVLAAPADTELFYSVAQQVAFEFREEGKFQLPDDWINLQVGHILSAYGGYQASFFEEIPGSR